jgi:hypothetical protein
MLDATYLRRQAERCLALSRSTFDLTTALQLRALAEDLRTRANELDDELPPYLIRRSGSPEDEMDRD